ncbi:MAG TPA: peptidoglycan-binding domain-containing protein [Solirubrobacteraceae bacterium]
MRRAALGAGGGLVAVAAATAGVLAGTSGGGEEAAGADGTTATKVAEITRRDLVESDAVDGTLGFSDARAVMNRLSGTVTWLPRVGAVVRTNRKLYEVDGKAVYLLDGATPAYRTLSASTPDGDDVRARERNLRRLGYDSAGAMRVDGSWDSGTTAAVKRWQASKGMEQTGSIAAGRIVFAPGSRRVAKLNVALGGSSGSGSADTDGGGVTGAIGGIVSSVAGALQVSVPTSTTPTTTPTTTTPTTTTPTPTTPAKTTPTATTPAKTTPTATTPAATTPKADTPAARGGGGPVLADGGGGGGGGGGGDDTGSDSDSGSGGGTASELMTTTSTRQLVTVKLDATKQQIAKRGARVSVELPSGDVAGGRIARVGKVATAPSSGEGEGGDATATLKVTVKLFKRVTALDQAPVTVNFEQSRAKNVLAVPVTALLAQPGGKFAVELREGTSRRLVPVTTGLYASGYVEIEGAGLRPGQRVTNAGI